ncbi:MULTISPECIES: DUF2785 domain-containing protein [Bacillus]|uniref:DUF2785 domain-containing protein n=1 Tax=Bacillus pseudomycoides TaxID=64104 RepID=A0AAJ1YYR5_9BACI|nr:DUF2785 domain-containing protein [Bacillus pseudomycoides]KFN15794.1 hypothetical protein DJ94_2975 [Bacillus pseudomycoides]MCR8859902.1 DUF2785 domain-containing protein [Bacillus pseudomycoides]MDR4190364.1 DUF2785 domain-containing protein [Bacillus pseudomycoides]MDR4326918.1 DUF2785 domain-containing protein [Bacillus pseudomycoides]MED0856345.1 DUF2785 domain-containing protein [Bacillus pseudomycoides]
MDIIALQQQLELIQQNDYTQMQNIDLNELSSHMIQNIGTTDSYVRDQLIYKCFAHFIQNEFLPHDQLETLLTTCLSNNYLYREIASPNTDGVFTRSYTTLLISLIIQFDNSHSFLLQETVQKVKEKLITYMNLEIDYRGYVQDKGWAHSIAHASDVFNELVHNPHITCSCYEEIAHCILNKIFIYSTVYHNNEDERIVTTLLSMLYYDFSRDQLFSIIYKKIKRLPQLKKRLSCHEYCKLCANLKNFLRTLFFRTKIDPNLSSVANRAEKMLKELHKYC